MPTDPRRRWGLLAAAVLLGALGLRTWGGRPVRVRTGAMEPTLAAGDVVWADRGAAEVGDPVLWERAPGDVGVSRVVAGGGQEVEIAAGALWIDGRKVPHRGGALGVDRPPLTLAPGEVFVLGDAPEQASDSRQWGPVSERSLRGRPRRIVWAPSRGAGLLDWRRLGAAVR